jgi:hypothetical protein
MFDTRPQRTQRGLSIPGFLFVAAVLVVGAMVGFRVVPSYVEYMGVKKALADALRDHPDAANSPQAFRYALERRLQTGYVESVKAADAQIAKSGNQTEVRIDWERRLHMAGNLYILLEFEATASR